MKSILIDMCGQKFSRLTVIERMPYSRNERGDRGTYWLCKCDCGKERVVSRQSLISKNTQSCGCLQKDVVRKLRFNNVAGRKFGKLTAINFLGNGHWLCKCDCGKEKITTINCLGAGSVKSCGCLHREVMKSKELPNAEASFNKLFAMYKNKSADRGHKFLLDKEEFRKLTKGTCHYCGDIPNQKSMHKKTSTPYIYNGIDRINSEGDYVDENCVSCCKACNYAKRMMSTESFKQWIKRVYDHFVKCNAYERA